MTARCPGSYLVVPPREWTRFQNAFSSSLVNPFDSINAGKTVHIPFVNNVVNLEDYLYEQAVLKKGSILQYKKNSSNLTKKQRYAQIARGMWVNRSKTWATQTETFTDPNTNSLKRNDYTAYNVSNQQVSTTKTITCPTIPPQNVFNTVPERVSETGFIGSLVPTQIISDPSWPIIPVIVIPPESSEVFDVIIPDGGTLSCNISENNCTGEVYNVTRNRDCYLNTESDVPGPFTLLCWNDAYPTTYAKTKLTYATSDNKWPTNSKSIKSALSVPTPPTNFIVTPVTGTGTFNLSWEEPVYTSNIKIDYYLVTVVSSDNTYFKSFNTSNTSAVVSELENNVKYTFKVSAVDEIGFGKKASFTSSS